MARSSRCSTAPATDEGIISDTVLCSVARARRAHRSANRLSVDSNVSPDGIAFPIPANDDAARAIRLYCEAIGAAATRGGQSGASARGVDIGAMVEPPVETALIEEPVAEPVVEEAVVEAVVVEEAAPAAEAPAEAPSEDAATA